MLAQLQLCSNLKINRHVSRLYNNLEKNHDISKQEFVLKDETGNSINSAKIPRKNFKNFVKNDNEIYDGSFENVHFEIISPIVKTVKGAKSWTGEFKGRPLSGDGIHPAAPCSRHKAHRVPPIPLPYVPLPHPHFPAPPCEPHCGRRG